MSELKRQKKVLNTMITMHSILRDRYKRLDLAVNILLLVSSCIITTLVFAGDETYLYFSCNPAKGKMAVGVFSILVFIISIVLLLVNWKVKSDNHGEAATQLSALLNECRRIEEMPDGTEKTSQMEAFGLRYTQVNGMIIRVPDAQFNRLKSRHYRKVELSKLIEQFPGSPIFILKVRMLRAAFKKKENE